jgi:2-haloacid dehalogenase
LTRPDVAALTFDVFGTVVDWRGTIIREGAALSERHGLDVDWACFADAWRAEYAPSMGRVRSGAIPWANLDTLHRHSLGKLLDEFGIDCLSVAEVDDLNHVWHRLTPWDDAVSGLTRLRRRYTLAALSNGNMSLLVNMAKRAALPWDCVLSAELARRYKPDPEVYRMAAAYLGLSPERVMMVAAHRGDLRAAAAVGMRTAFVHRPLEHGPGSKAGRVDTSAYDIAADDFQDLARRLAM